MHPKLDGRTLANDEPNVLYRCDSFIKFSFSKPIESLHTVFRVYAIIPGRLPCKMCTVLELNLYERF